MGRNYSCFGENELGGWRQFLLDRYGVVEKFCCGDSKNNSNGKTVGAAHTRWGPSAPRTPEGSSNSTNRPRGRQPMKPRPTYILLPAEKNARALTASRSGHPVPCSAGDLPPHRSPALSRSTGRKFAPAATSPVPAKCVSSLLLRPFGLVHFT